MFHITEKTASTLASVILVTVTMSEVNMHCNMETQQQHTRVHISTTLKVSLMNTTPAAQMGMF